MTPTLRAAIVVLITAVLKLGADAIGLPLDEAVLTALAIAIVAKILGEPAGTYAAQKIRKE